MVAICISHPKSGRTWLRMILFHLEVELSYSHLGSGADRGDWGNTFEGMRLAVPEQARLIFLHRDPADTIVSFFHEMVRRQLPKISPATLAEYESRGRLPPRTDAKFIQSRRFGIERLCRFNLWCLENLPAACILSYEKLSRSPETEIAMALRFLDQDREPAQIARAVAASSFDRMQAMERSGAIPESFARRMGAVDPSDPDSYKVRRGKIGGWRTELSAEAAEAVESYLQRSGYADQVRGIVARRGNPGL